MTLEAWLQEKPFTMSLSSGFFGFFTHVGFMKALLERDLKPAAYVGASAGSIVAAGLAAGMKIEEVEDVCKGLTRDHIWDPSPGLGFLRGKKMEKLFRQIYPKNFGELHTGLTISVFDVLKLSTRTFSTGDLPRVCRASCAMPLIFHPVWIGGRPFSDGGIRDKMAIHGLPANTRLLCNYLHGTSRSEFYELKKSQKSLGPDQKMVRLKDIPATGPNYLHLGPEIIAAAYKQTAELLSAPAP